VRSRSVDLPELHKVKSIKNIDNFYSVPILLIVLYLIIWLAIGHKARIPMDVNRQVKNRFSQIIKNNRGITNFFLK